MLHAIVTTRAHVHLYAAHATTVATGFQTWVGADMGLGLIGWTGLGLLSQGFGPIIELAWVARLMGLGLVIRLSCIAQRFGLNYKIRPNS